MTDFKAKPVAAVPTSAFVESVKVEFTEFLKQQGVDITPTSADVRFLCLWQMWVEYAQLKMEAEQEAAQYEPPIGG